MALPGASGSLFVVSTPIGNMGDMSFRAVEILGSAALVVAEDTRHSRHLLDHFEIPTPCTPYHEHNEARETPRLIARLEAGESIALITDAGTPLLSDPGARLVSAAIAAGVDVIPVPGASAALAALVASGIAADRFTFFGFLPRKGKDRSRALSELARLPHTAVVYESPLRVAATLADLSAVGAGERSAVVARELTKKFEAFARGTVDDLAARFADKSPRGEVVVVVAGAILTRLDDDTLRSISTELRGDGCSTREIIERLISEHGAARNVAYRLAHEE
ncbi:MAG: 16S rRNA (cytidine(1402)-2'-O)-methyltransferase [Gemmatimonadaceae bacterium]